MGDFSVQCGRFFLFGASARFLSLHALVKDFFQKESQIEPKRCRNGVPIAPCLRSPKKIVFVFGVAWTVSNFALAVSIVHGENAHASETRRCPVATLLCLFFSRTDADLKAFWNSKVASKWHLQAIGNGMDQSSDFGMRSRAVGTPTCAALGSIWASLSSIRLHLGRSRPP